MTEPGQTPTAARRTLKYGLFAACLIAIVVVPFVLFGTSLEGWTFGLMESSRPAAFIAAVGALLLAVDIVLPIPSTVVAAGLGALLGAPLGIAAAAIGLTAGCVVGYGLGRYLGHDFALRELGPSDFAYLSGLLDRYGLWLLAACRPVPVLAEASVIAAGVVGMRPIPVLVVTALANIGFAIVYAGLGASAEGLSGFLAAFAASLALPGIALLVAKRVRASHAELDAPPPG
jgi:uncharacterized membrane protein YdjX (TVP38/TMEM64 family)